MEMGVVFDIKRFAVHDGPGIRTTVFMKGCTLSCWWCHNPESWSLNPLCVSKNVKLDAHTFVENEIVGKETHIEEIIFQLKKEQIIMEESGGGVTFSGGEPLMQPLFLKELLEASKKEGFHTAVDTSGFGRQDDFKDILPFTDLFLFDLKLMDDQLHQKYTGVSNKLILENLKFLSEKGKKIRIRIPVINGINDSKENLKNSIKLLKNLNQIEQVDLLPYHHIGKSKYERFGMKYRMPNQKEIEKNGNGNHKKPCLRNEGFKVKIGG